MQNSINFMVVIDDDILSKSQIYNVVLYDWYNHNSISTLLTIEPLVARWFKSIQSRTRAVVSSSLNGNWKFF